MLSVKGDRSLVFLYVIRYEIEHFLEQGQQNYSGFLSFAQDETSLIRLKQAVGWEKIKKLKKTIQELIMKFIFLYILSMIMTYNKELNYDTILT